MKIKERWALIHNTEYEISTHGDIRNIVTRTIRKCNKDRSGYLKMVVLNMNKRYITIYPHRLVAKTFIPHDELRTTVNHIDGDKTNNDISNLEWSTSHENTMHAIKTGLMPKATRHDKEVVIQMTTEGKFIEAYANANTASKLSGVSSTAMYCAITGRSKTAGGYAWKRVPIIKAGRKLPNGTQKENA